MSETVLIAGVPEGKQMHAFVEGIRIVSKAILDVCLAVDLFIGGSMFVRWVFRGPVNVLNGISESFSATTPAEVQQALGTFALGVSLLLFLTGAAALCYRWSAAAASRRIAS